MFPVYVLPMFYVAHAKGVGIRTADICLLFSVLCPLRPDT